MFLFILFVHALKVWKYNYQFWVNTIMLSVGPGSLGFITTPCTVRFLYLELTHNDWNPSKLLPVVQYSTVCRNDKMEIPLQCSWSPMNIQLTLNRGVETLLSNSIKSGRNSEMTMT